MACYLVTGGAGFIGSHLAERLLRAGHDTISLDNLDPFYPAAMKEGNLRTVADTAREAGRGFQDVRGDIRDASLLKKLFAGQKIDGVFHLAALAGVRPSIERPLDYWDVNVLGTARLLEEMRAAGVARLVFASSSSVYGGLTTVPFREDMRVDCPISPYAATKKAGELLCHTASHLHGIHCICIRFFTVYGPRQRPDLAIHKFARRMLAGKSIPFYGDGTTERDYTYVSDICDGLLAAMQHADACAWDIINLGESTAISLTRLVELLEAGLGCRAKLERLPPQPGDMERTWADISHAREVLGYAPKVTKEDGIRLFLEWLKRSPG